MQVTNSKPDGGDDEEGNDDDDEVEENSMGNQGWPDMILPTITNTASHRVLSNKQRVIVPPLLVLTTWVRSVKLCELLEEGSQKKGILSLVRCFYTVTTLLLHGNRGPVPP